MLDPEYYPYLIALLAATSVGIIAFVAVYPYLSGERHAAKRMANATIGRKRRVAAAATAATQEDLQNRRKQVAENLKEMEDKQKAKSKVTMRKRLMRAGIDATPRQFYIASLGVGLLVGVGVFVGASASAPVAGLAAFAATLGLPRWFLSFMAKRRQAKFIAEFANAIDVVVRGVKSGLPLNECLQIIARESPEPVCSEFRDLVEQQRVGVPLAEGFTKMLDRMPLPEVNFFAIVIAIQQSAGGNLAEALGNLSGVLRSRKMLAAKVKALSSEAKASAAILGALPFTVMTMVYMTSPDYISLLWTDKMGHLMLVGAAFWMFCGIMVMRQMINFKY